MSTATAPVYEWKTIPWRKLERTVFKLQTRIYQASQRGDVTTVHHLQRLLMRSWSAKCLAVRRVTQDNRGKHTAGVDGVKSLTAPQRVQLARTLSITRSPRPTRRVWIPKPGTDEQRPLGIPVLHDRAAQALLKLALEPEWEARFEPNSYGFRPGRSGHDAIVAIFLALCRRTKYVLDADIAKCFDRINHAALLRKLGAPPTIRRAIRAWLKAGVLDGSALFPTEEGVPQGGVLSPLLANIALHGLETAIGAAFPARHQGQQHWRPLVIRYADDFVVVHPDQGVIEQVHQLAAAWLRDLGLELKPSKTQIVHSLHVHDGKAAGFDFLGFTVRQFPSGKTHCARQVTHGRLQLLGFKTLITPSKAALHRHRVALSHRVDRYTAAPQAALIGDLQPRIQGWTRYYASVCSKRAFGSADNWLFGKLCRWARRRHPGKGWHWVARKYWRNGWTFAVPGPSPVRLVPHAATPIRRHVKVQGRRSPYDGDWLYWATRRGRHPATGKRVARLLKGQAGKCAWCGLFFTAEDRLEVDHVIPRTGGGDDRFHNLQLLHGHCHDAKTAADLRALQAEAVEVSVTTTIQLRSRMR